MPAHPTAGTCHSEPSQRKQCNPSPPATGSGYSVRVKELRHEYVQVSVSVLYIYNTEWVQSSNM